MQFLLTAVNAKYIHSNPAVYSLKAYAGSQLQPYIALAQYTINQKTEEILGDLYKRHPDVIGFSCYIWNIDVIQELLWEIPKVLPDTDIWLGGPEVSYDGEILIKKLPMKEQMYSLLNSIKHVRNGYPFSFCDSKRQKRKDFFQTHSLRPESS